MLVACLLLIRHIIKCILFCNPYNYANLLLAIYKYIFNLNYVVRSLSILFYSDNIIFISSKYGAAYKDAF
jgi:hypothetical protein